MIISTISAVMLMMQQSPAEGVDWDAEFGVEERVRDPETGEFPVDEYEQRNENAGATPFDGGSMAEAFGGRAGIRRLADRLVEKSVSDPRISEIFIAHDQVRLKRTLFEQFCYILNAGCAYSGRDMATAHEAMGLRMADLNALVENLQASMREADVPFAAQNRFLSKLAPMSGDIIERK